MSAFGDWWSHVKERMTGPIRLLSGAVQKFNAENGPIIAAAISFYTLLSLLPLLLLGVAVFGYVIGSSDRAFDAVVKFFNTFVPTSTFVEDTLSSLVSARGVIGWVGILTLLWTGSQLFVTLQMAFDDIWEVVTMPGFIKSRIKAILMVLVFGIFLIISIGSSSFVAFLQQSPGDGGFFSNTAAGLLSTLAVIVGLIFAIIMFTVVYRYVPDTNVQWRSAFLGAILAGVAWVIAKELYRIYLTNFADFNKFYGSLGSVVILILWIYYSSIILVFGAELAYAHQYGPKEEPEEANRMGQS